MLELSRLRNLEKGPFGAGTQTFEEGSHCLIGGGGAPEWSMMRLSLDAEKNCRLESTPPGIK